MAYALGIDLGGTKILAGLIDTATGDVLSTAVQPTRAEHGPDNVLMRLLAVAEDAIAQSSVPLSDVAAIGVGAAGRSLTLAYDGSNDLLDPTRGFRLSGWLSPEYSGHGQSLIYGRTQFDASAYHPVRNGVVLAGRIRAGTILGANAFDLVGRGRHRRREFENSYLAAECLDAGGVHASHGCHLRRIAQSRTTSTVFPGRCLREARLS